jgi:hypothetical protein
MDLVKLMGKHPFLSKCRGLPRHLERKGYFPINTDSPPKGGKSKKKTLKRLEQVPTPSDQKKRKEGQTHAEPPSRNSGRIRGWGTRLAPFPVQARGAPTWIFSDLIEDFQTWGFPVRIPLILEKGLLSTFGGSSKVLKNRPPPREGGGRLGGGPVSNKLRVYILIGGVKTGAVFYTWNNGPFTPPGNRVWKHPKN